VCFWVAAGAFWRTQGAYLGREIRMAVRRRKPARTTRSKRRKTGTVRPIKPVSPKGKVALLMMEGQHTYAAIAKKTRTTLNNIYQHATHMRARGHKIRSMMAS
jgi:hypothetical protein